MLKKAALSGFFHLQRIDSMLGFCVNLRDNTPSLSGNNVDDV
jgi:hypothetical protein